MPGFGQNGSIAWVVVGKPGSVHVQSPHKDGWRGKIDDPHNSTVKHFLVRLRFANERAANDAWGDKGVDDQGPGKYLVTLKVPAQPRDETRTHLNLHPETNEPNVNPPWEIFIDWEFVQPQA